MDSSSLDPFWITMCVVAQLSLIAYLAIVHAPLRDGTNDGRRNIPWAPGAIPVLGHALRYKENPPAFLVQSVQQVGNIFRLNMAGKEMIIVVGPEEQRLVARAPESQLSARKAVSELGFEEMLGPLNVHTGTDLHKGIVKGVWHTNPNKEVQEWLQAFRNSLQLELSTCTGGKIDLLKYLRRVFLRATIDRMISPELLEDWDFAFLDEFMGFQDMLEDATAKSVVLPRWVALPLFLRPVQRRREALQILLVGRLEELVGRNHVEKGFWWKGLEDQHTTTTDIAELIVGLLFAAHKNPAIGASQTYLMLHEMTDADTIAKCHAEAKAFLADPSKVTWDLLQMQCPTLRHATLECLRLTAHSLGAVRTAQTDFSVGNYVIPKGASISLAHVATHKNPLYWKHPDHLDVTRPATNYDDEYRFTTFSHGVHKCPGQQTALVMIQCVVALVLDEYDVQLPDSVPVIDFERATLAQRAASVFVRIKPKQ